MELYHKFFWIAFIIVGFINGGIFYSRVKSAEIDEETEKINIKLIKNFVMIMTFPFLVMGLGLTIGGIESHFSYFNLSDFNVWIYSFYGSIILMEILVLKWLLISKGYEDLEKVVFYNHPLVKGKNISFVIIISIVGSIIAMVNIYLSGDQFSSIYDKL